MHKLLRAALPSLLVLGLVVSVPGDSQAQEMMPMAEGEPEPEVEVLLDTQETSLGQPLTYPTLGDAQVTVVKVTIPQGAKTSVHSHAIPLMGRFMQGELKVDYADGTTQRFSAGDTSIEALGRCHQGQAVGNEDVKLLAVFMRTDRRPPQNPCNGN